VKETKGKRKE